TAGSLTSLVRDSADSTNKTALATTSASDHGLQIGDRVKVSGDASTWQSLYNGIFVITGVPATNQFRYKMTGAVGGGGSSSGISYRKVFGVANILIERNMIDLAIGLNAAAA